MSVGTKGRQAGVIVLVWLSYFCLLLFTALPQGLKTTNPETLATAGSYHVGAFGLWAGTGEWIQAFGPTDPASYAKAGREIATEGWVKTPFLDVAWPPGEYLLHAALLRLHAPVPLSLIVLSCGLWSCAFLQLFCFVRRRLSPPLAAALPLAVLATELMRHFFLRGWGPYLSEGPSCPLLVKGVGFLVFALEPLAWPTGSASGDLLRTVWAGCCSGVSFALAAYIRAQVELILALVSVTFLLAALMTVLVAVWRSGVRPAAFLRSLRTSWWKSGLLTLSVVLMTFHSCTLPYRVLHNYRRYGYWEWTSGYSFVWPLMWRDPASVPVEGNFFVQGGGQAPGILAADWHVDASRLTPEEGRALTLKLIRKRPGAWLRYKLPILSQYWFSRNCAAGMTTYGSAYWENGAILLCLLVTAAGCVVGLFQRRYAGVALWLLSLIACVIVASIGPPLLIHFEARYLHPLKVVGVFVLPYGAALTLRARGVPVEGAGRPDPGVESDPDEANGNRQRVEREVA
jgi:hypothetical protein